MWDKDGREWFRIQVENLEINVGNVEEKIKVWEKI